MNRFVPPHFREIYPAEEVSRAVVRVAAEITPWAEEVHARTREQPLALCILRGAFLFHADLIEAMHQTMRGAGFADIRTFYFPQCIYPSGWWSGTMAGKGSLDAFRKVDAEARPFATAYYNVDIHQAAFATPEFLRQRLNPR